ncbi:hypothetical protein NXH64_08720 [Butyrivibrio fibrisolvens]|uniref:hypothetical protein n=1 Tax=Pseudobutyrivibrio ruminis TaxID=46206 RepID=UPI000400ACAF|nr:hypothetical protein [Pseudobutyrivibrio ruminis]MDC7279582.1 hypothetical protein [Butyrivibrio fibrisolvens]
MDIPKIVIANVRKTNLIRRIKEYGIDSNLRISDDDFKDWLDDLINSGKMQESDLNDCFFEELMYGYRRLMRVYKITQTRHLREADDWQNLLDQFNCPSLNFNSIISTPIVNGETLKIVAIRSNASQDRIHKVEIMFLYRMRIVKNGTNSMSTFYSYIPVVIDLDKKILIMKIWNKEEAYEGDRPNEQLEKVIGLLQEYGGITTRGFTDSHQKVLYKMSKSLFDNFFKELPNYDLVVAKRDEIPSIVDSLIRGIDLQNYEENNGLMSVNKDTLDLNGELYKILQQVALSDYLINNSIENLLVSADKFISKIRFSDRDNLTASLMGEAGVKCIFDAQTYMCIRNSLDIVEKIVSLVVNYSSMSVRGKMLVKYDAATNDYLVIHIINDCYYTSEDFSKFWEIYEQYESSECVDGEIRALCQEYNVEAM